MGNDPPAQSPNQVPQPANKNTSTPKKSQQQILAQATKITQQLQLYKDQRQYKQHRHLIARILIYGHNHLITHMRAFSKQQQQQIMRQLKSIDYQTTDLLYQNIVLNKIKGERKKIEYKEYVDYLKKQGLRETSNEGQKHRQKTKINLQYKNKSSLIEAQGGQILKNKKVAILIFVGGINPRFKSQSNKYEPKQFYKQKQDQKCLLQIILDRLQAKKQIYPNLVIYLAHSESTASLLKGCVQKHPSLHINKVFQNENPIVNLSGKLCIRNQNTFEIITSPRGCGDLTNLIVSGKGVKLLQDIKNQNIQYIIGFGCQNILVDVIDQYLIGVLASDEEVSVAFKCTYPDNENQNLKRVVYNPVKKSLQATQLQVLLENADKNSWQIIRRSPVWTNYVAFKCKKLQQYFSNKRQNLSTSQALFVAKNIQYTYWNPASQSYYQNQHCYMFEQQLNGLLLGQDLKSIGIMVERENQFLPIVSICEDKTWGDAYSQYTLKQKKEQISHSNFKNKINQNIRINHFSIQSALENSELDNN